MSADDKVLPNDLKCGHKMLGTVCTYPLAHEGAHEFGCRCGSREPEPAICGAETVVHCQLPPGHKRDQHQTLGGTTWEPTEQSKDDLADGTKVFSTCAITHTVLLLRERPDRMDQATRNRAADIIENLYACLQRVPLQAKSDISAHTMAAIFDAFKTEMLIGFDSFREFEEQAGEIRTEALRRRIGAALNG